MKRSHLRLGVRLARRELRRRPWRTALVLLMVLVPTVAMTLAVVAIRTSEWDAEDKRQAQIGRADASAFRGDGEPATPPELDALLAAFPPGTRIQVSRGSYDRVRTVHRRTYFDIVDTPLDDPMNDGRFGEVRGRLPRTGEEVVITTQLADRLDAEIGDRYRLDAFARRVRVVGIVRPNSAADTAFLGARLPDGPRTSTSILLDLPDRADPERVVESAQLGGWQFEHLRPDVPDAGSQVFWVYVGGGVGLIVLGTVITAAFAVGARRQLRSIGLLSASGAAPATVKWFLVGQGAVAGAVGSLAGVLLTLVGVRFVPHRVVEEIAERPIGGPVVRFSDLLPIIAIGTLVAAGASWLPARSAARVPTLQALAGRRPLPKVPARLPVLGAAAVGAGCGLLAMAVAGSRGPQSSSLWAVVAVLGGLAVVMGAVAIGPWIVAGLERAGHRLRAGGRLASRSLARNRVRSSAVIGAISAVAILVVTGSTLYESARASEDSEARPYLATVQIVIDSSQPVGGEAVGRPAPMHVAERVTRAAPGAMVIPIRSPELPPPTQSGVPSHGAAATLLPADSAVDGEFRGVAIATEPLLDHLEVPAHLRAALDRGEVVSVTRVPEGIRSARIHLPPGGATAKDPTGPVLPFGGSFDSPNASFAVPTLLVGPAGLARAGLGSAPSTVTLVALPEHVTDEQWAQLELVQDDVDWELQMRSEAQPNTGFTYVSVSLPNRPPVLTQREVKALILAAAALLVLAVVAVGLALAAQDEAEERQILEAVGAPPRVVRRTTAMKAALLAFIAGVVAVPAGLLPAAAIVAAASSPTAGQSRGWDLRPDTTSIVLVLLVVPLLAGTVTWVGGRVRSILRPARPDVFAFGE